jgi:murein DD-endopeptidase MepM/ murein hydrolase activator NlpD
MYNPFVGVSPYTLYFTWAQHIAAGFSGGVDYATGTNSGYPVHSAVTGTVVGAGLDSAGNSVLTIDAGGGVKSVFMHMRQFSVSVGSGVAEGQSVGLSGGHTGDWGRGQATGPHCHWHLLLNNVRADPIAYLAGHSSGQPNPTPSRVVQEDQMGSYYLRYTSSNPNVWIAVNDLDKTYRIIPAATFETTRLDSLDSLGLLPQINIADPVWGQTYGNGQFTSIT